MQLVPAAGPNMQLGDQLRLTPSQLSFEELADERVHAEPGSVLSQGDDEEVALRERSSSSRAPLPPTSSTASQTGPESVSRMEVRVRNLHKVVRLTIQELLSEVVPHRRSDHVEGLSAGACGQGTQQGAHRQAKPGRPALGSLHELLDGAGRKVKAEGVGHHRGLPHGKPQVVGLHPHRTAREQQTPNANLQARPGGEDQQRSGRPRIDEVIEAVEGISSCQVVSIVDDENESVTIAKRRGERRHR